MQAGSSQAAEETKNRAYANALMELAKEEDNVEKVKEDFEDFSKYVQMHTGVRILLNGEGIPPGGCTQSRVRQTSKSTEAVQDLVYDWSLRAFWPSS